MLFDFRSYINILRAIAIFSVVCAHVSTSGGGYFNILIGNMGTYGVGLFLFLSGYFFSFDKKGIKTFTVSKFKNIFLPWMVCGTLDWLYVVLRKGNINIESWCDSVFVHSHYYFLTVLMILFFSLYYFRNNIRALYVIFLLSLLSCFLTTKGLLDFIYIYINPFNWAVFFVIGLIVGKYKLMDKIIHVSAMSFPYTSMLFLYYIVLIVWDCQSIKYWGNGNVIFGIAAIGVFMGLAYYLNRSISIVKRTLCYIGSVSFTIYLIHMPMAGIVSKLTKNIGVVSLQILAPFIVLFVVTSVVWLLLRLSRPLGVNAIVKLILGVRK